MTAENIDIYQERYLAHQKRKKAILEGKHEKATITQLGWDGNFREVVNSRKSQRTFSDEVISNYEWIFIRDCLSRTPSSCNRQAVKIMVIENAGGKFWIEKYLVGGVNWISKADKILLLFADMTAYKNQAEVSFMPYLDAGFIGMTAYYAAESIGAGCCFVNPNIREENKESFNGMFNQKGFLFCGAIALGYYNDRAIKPNKSKDIFI